uniref:Uncharacterized protein n=1 Tax=Fagus sylvatica TaxID=28930 RepID=A0A2N9G412_FAGSY
MWISFAPYWEFQETLDDLNLHDQNQVEIVFRTTSSYDPPKITPTIKGCGVHVKCICPPLKFGESNMHHQCHSTNTLLPLLPPLFSSSYGSDMDYESSNNVKVSRISSEITNNEFYSSLKGLHGDDSDVRECQRQPPLVPVDIRHLLLPSDVGLPMDVSNGSDLGLGRLIFESTIRDGYDLGSSSMTDTFGSSDSDLNSYPPSKKMRTS